MIAIQFTGTTCSAYTTVSHPAHPHVYNVRKNIFMLYTVHKRACMSDLGFQAYVHVCNGLLCLCVCECLGGVLDTIRQRLE